jgi:hypothetical protein
VEIFLNNINYLFGSLKQFFNIFCHVCPKLNFDHRLVKAALSRYLKVAEQTKAVYDKGNIIGATAGLFARRRNQKSSTGSRKQ